jgi:hypothetical protein
MEAGIEGLVMVVKVFEVMRNLLGDQGFVSAACK